MTSSAGFPSSFNDLMAERRMAKPSTLRPIDWRAIEARPLECPCRARASDGPCANEIREWPPFQSWLTHATSRLDLSTFKFIDGIEVGAGWRAAEDLGAPIGVTDTIARVAVSSAAGFLRSTYESMASGRRVDPLEQRLYSHELDDFEGAAVQLAFDSGVALPVNLHLAFGPAFWRSLGDRTLSGIVVATKRSSRDGVQSTLQDARAMACLVWINANRPAGFEAFLLELEPHCERKHLRALRRAIDGETARHRSELRLRRARERLLVQRQLRLAFDDNEIVRELVATPASMGVPAVAPLGVDLAESDALLVVSDGEGSAPE